MNEKKTIALNRKTSTLQESWPSPSSLLKIPKMRDATWRPSLHKFRLQSTPRLWTVAQRVQGIPGLLGISGREGDLICVSASSSSSSCSSWDEPSPSSSISSNRATLVMRDCFVFFSLIFFFFFFFFFFSSFSSDLSCFDFLDFRLAFEVSDCYRKKRHYNHLKKLSVNKPYSRYPPSLHAL